MQFAHDNQDVIVEWPRPEENHAWHKLPKALLEIRHLRSFRHEWFPKIIWVDSLH